jgi:hypothetical protein
MTTNTACLNDAERFAIDLAKSGCRESEVRRGLLNRGLGAALARALACDAVRSSRSSRRLAGLRHMLLGAFGFGLAVGSAVLLHKYTGNTALAAVPAVLSVIGVADFLRGVCVAIRNW